MASAHTNTCLRICQLGAVPKDQGREGLADQALLRAYTCVLQKSGLQLGVDILPRLHRPAAASIHICVVEGCTQGSRVAIVRPTTCCCEHTYVCCRIDQIKAAPKGRNVTKVRPAASKNNQTQGFAQGSTVTTTGCCRHTHVCRRTNQCRVAPRVKVYKGLADHMLLGAYTCVLQNRRNQGCTQGSEVTKVWPSSCCCEHTHTICVLRTPKSQGLQGFGRPTSTESMQAETSRRIGRHRVASKARVTKVWPTKWLQGCTQGSRVAIVRATTCCCEHTHVCCQIDQVRAAPQGRKVTGARPTGCCCRYTHVCCRIIKLRVSPKDQRLQRLADHWRLLAHTYVLQNKSMQSCTEGQGLQRFGRKAYTCAWQNRRNQGCTQGLRVTKVWPNSCCCEHTHTSVAEYVSSGLYSKFKGYKGFADQLLL